jgi:hypothetical protein
MSDKGSASAVSSQLSDVDVERITSALAPKIAEHVRKSHRDFWIDPEQHYQDHFRMRALEERFTPEFMQALVDVATTFKKGRGIFFGIFLTMVLMGAIGLASWSFITGHK